VDHCRPPATPASTRRLMLDALATLAAVGFLLAVIAGLL